MPVTGQSGRLLTICFKGFATKAGKPMGKVMPSPWRSIHLRRCARRQFTILAVSQLPLTQILLIGLCRAP